MSSPEDAAAPAGDRGGAENLAGGRFHSQDTADLAIARDLAYAGVRIFLARPAIGAAGRWNPKGGTGGTGYHLPVNWQATEADPDVLEAWRPGMAVCAVMGDILDLVDIDPRNGGDVTAAALQAAGIMPTAYAVADTPSGGRHYYVAPLHVGSRDGLAPGLDVKGGRRDGTGRGFAFIAPTVKLSKETGNPARYVWTTPPDLDRLAEDGPTDDTGTELAEMIRGALADTGKDTPRPDIPHEAYDAMPPRRQAEVDRYLDGAMRSIAAELEAAATWPEGYRDDRGRGWEKLLADACCRIGALARADWTPWTLETAWHRLAAIVPARMAEAVGLADKWRAQHGRGAPASQPPALTPLIAPGHEAATRTETPVTANETATDEPRGAPEWFTPLTELLAEPDTPVTFRIGNLLPAGGRAVCAAQFKAGKTTMTNNLIRSVADGVPFLDEFEVDPLPDGATVGLIDDEMNRDQIRRWLRDQEIAHPERVYVATLRGRVAEFDLLAPEVRTRWAESLRAAGVTVLIFDCLRPVLDALGLEEARDAGRFLVAFDALLAEAGVTEAIVVHHMGHNGERSRGDSRIRDWPDVEWRLVRESGEDGETDPAARRYFSAYGRDVDVAEGALTFDPETRHLAYAAGGRKKARRERQDISLRPYVMRAVAVDPGITVAGLTKAIRDMEDAPSFQDRQVSRVARGLAEEGIIRIEDGGPGRPKKHFYVSASNPVQTPSQTGLDALPLTPSTPSIGDGVGVGGADVLPDVGQVGRTCELCGRQSRFSLIVGKCRTCALRVAS